MLLLFFSSFCLLTTGCATAPEPRVIAERVFAGDQLIATLTTYPGDPQDLTITSCQASNEAVGDIEMQKIEIEGRPGWRLHCLAPTEAEELTLHAVVHHAGRRFAVTIPFRRRTMYIARQGKDIKRWTTRRERITNLGPDDLFLTRSP